MAKAPEHGNSYEAVGPREYLERLLAEYHLQEEELGDRIQVRTPPRWSSGEVPPQEYLVHDSMLRPHGAYACAGDEEALAFCEEADHWAALIYYGPDSLAHDSQDKLQPLPPP